METRTYYIALAIITVLLSVSYLNAPQSLVSFALSLVTLGSLSYFGTELFTNGVRSLKVLITVALTAVLALFDIYAVIPLVAYAITIYLYHDKKLTYSRALMSSTITAFSFPIAYSVSSYATVMAPLILLQASGLAVVKETIYPGKRALGAVAYSVPFVALLGIAFGRWLEMVAIALVAWWVYRRVGREVISYESVLKLLVAFSAVTFTSYVLPLYVLLVNQRAYEYLSIITGFK